MFKINCLNNISKFGLELLDENYKIMEDINQADAILVRSQAMHEMTFSNNLLAVARAGAGVNNIPLDKCADQGIVVFNTPGANANGVKELVIAGMLLASRDIASGITWVKENTTDPDIAKTVEKQKAKYAGTEISGKKLGVIGLGAIGVLVANAAKHLGMEVYGFDPFLSVEHALNLSRDIKIVKTLDDIYQVADFISIHVPAMKDTNKMLNQNAFDKMQDGVVILNFARDLLVDDTDMAKALKSGKVKKYVTDFPNPEVVKMENVIMIPHLGASTEESEDNCAIMAVKQIADYLENGNIRNSVNYPSCDFGVCQTEGRIAICHKNVPNMIKQYSDIFGCQNINIYNMENRSKGEYAYSIFDVETKTTDELVKKLSAVNGTLKVRIIK